MRFLFGIVLVSLLLSGCSQSEFKQLETGAIAGSFNGHPVEISWKRDTSGKMVVDLKIPQALGAVASVASGGWSDFVGEALGALLAMGGAGYGVSQRNARRRAEADASEGWAKYEASEGRARDLALRVPPRIHQD